MALDNINPDIPLETEHGMNPDHPIVRAFTIMLLEDAARKQNSDLHCPRCNTNLPYNEITVAPVFDGLDANRKPREKIRYFCTICQDYFDK